METTTYIKSAYEVEVGDIVCEADGFMWTVMDRVFRAGYYTFTLLPRFASMTTREARTVRLKRGRNVRVAQGVN